MKAASVDVVELRSVESVIISLLSVTEVVYKNKPSNKALKAYIYWSLDIATIY